MSSMRSAGSCKFRSHMQAYIRTADNLRRSPPPPPNQSDFVGKNEICNRENLIGPFLVHKILGPRSPTPRFPPLFSC